MMLIAKVVQTLIMIVFMKTAKPVSTCPSDISFKKLSYARYNTTNQKCKPELSTSGHLYEGLTKMFYELISNKLDSH